MRKLSKEKISEIQKLRSEGLSIIDIASKLAISETSVYKYITNSNAKYIPKNKIYWLDLKKDYFNNIDTEEKAYFLGFIAGDGNIKDNMIRLRIVEDDKEILERFKKAVNYHKPLTYITPKNGRRQARLVFRSSQMCKDLAKYHIVPNKSMTIKLPELEGKLMRAYLLGLFDADGSVFYSKFKRKDRNKEVERYGFSIITNIVLSKQIMQFLENEIGIKLSMSSKKKNPNLAILQVSRNNDLVKLARYLYDNPTLGLTRKKVKFSQAHDFYQDGCSTTTISAADKADGIVSSYEKS